MFYNLTNRAGQSTLSVFGQEEVKVIPASHPFFSEILGYLTQNEEHDEAHVGFLLDPALHVGQRMAAISDRVTYDLGHVYLDGVEVDQTVAHDIVSRIQAREDSWDRLVRFLVKVSDNPSYRSQEAVYQWVQRHGVQITEDGDFVGYKGVQNNGCSLSAGPNNFIDGVLFGEAGKPYNVPHEVGTVVSKRRSDVDDSTALACSTGLHVGTHAYACNFGERLLTVKVNPANVVSVPSDDSEWKIRVCEYAVIALNDGREKFTGYTYDFEEPATENVNVLGLNDDGTFDEEDESDVPAEEEVRSTRTFKTLGEAAEAFPVLDIDLRNANIGHKELARNWVGVTTESSIRRWRKAHGITRG